jgi:hypothetical protein
VRLIGEHCLLLEVRTRAAWSPNLSTLVSEHFARAFSGLSWNPRQLVQTTYRAHRCVLFYHRHLPAESLHCYLPKELAFHWPVQPVEAGKQKYTMSRSATTSSFSLTRKPNQCDGRRPQCHECVARETPCQYTETETVILKRKHEDLEALFNMLKSFPEQEATALLARVRAGADPSMLVEQVKHGSLLMQLLASSQQGEGTLSSSSHPSL